MATKKQSTGGSEVTNYVANASPADGDPMPTAAAPTKAKQYGQPIGRPNNSQFVTDPHTGEIVKDSQGNPIPWTATRIDPKISRVGGEAAGNLAATQVMPKYYEGDAEEILNNMPPELLAQLQAHMADARVYGKNPNIVYGIADAETMTAFKQVLTAANNTGYDYQTVIQNWGRIAKNAPPEPPTPHVTKVSNTLDLVATFKKASRDALGRELSDSEARRYASVLQGQEAGAQHASDALGDTGQSGTVMDAPSPSAFLDAQLKQNQPGEYGANRFATTFDTFQSLLKGAG